MENFFEWMVKPIPKDEIETWFNIHNIHNEKIQLFGDIFISLYYLISDTYFDEESVETKIILTTKQNAEHFEWCWNRLIEHFKQENIIIEVHGEHRDYIESFFLDTFYSPINDTVKNSLPTFLKQTFRMYGRFTKSDLDILTEIYKLMDKSIN